MAAALLALRFIDASEQQARGSGAAPNAGFVPLTPPTQGGPFNLIDHRGRAVSDRDYRGSFLLVFFGYTYCPDVCPTELQTISQVLDLLGAEDGAKVQPLFVSVDPERDTPQVLADYVDAFHPRIVGLTGSAEQIATAARAFHVGYMKLPLPSEDEDEGKSLAEGDEYGMAHSATTYLVGPRGRILATYPRGVAPEDLAGEVRKYLKDGA
ncbi:MAG: hypothetical protein CMM08_19330 [Rhodospirillaceae bacterium]|nr:hypothetical protein [Rhodospirillaceae bacterium]